MLVNPTLSHLSQVCARFPRVSILGVGNEGNTIVSHIFENGGYGAQCIAVDTDKESFEHVCSHQNVLIPYHITDAAAGLDHHEPQETVIRECTSLMTPLLAGTDVAFIVARMGNEKTARVSPLIADVARRVGAVTVGVAIMPLPFERDDRLVGYHGLAGMRHSCHTVAITDAARPIQTPMCPPDVCGEPSDRIAIDMISGLAETLACPSAVNIDPAAFRELMTHGGIAHVGIAYSSSPLRVEQAIVAALRGPLLYDNIMRTRGVLLNLRGDSELTLEEAEIATQVVGERVGWDTPVVVGARIDESLADGLQVSVLLTGGAYPYIPGGYRRLPLEMYEMEPDGEEEGRLDLVLDLDQLE